jgi:hypothetical protein
MVTRLTVDVMVTGVAKDLPWSVEESAVTDTLFPEGTSRGAVNMLDSPLAVCGGAKVPQFGALGQTETQSTPALATSLVTIADTVAAPPTGSVAGGA